ncbi:MAG: hypothetical protein WCQ69_09885, partial [Bacteroidales bacterium]
MGFYARFVPTKGALKAYFDTVYSAINAIFGSTGTTDGTVPRADGTGGKTLQSSGVVIDDNNDVTGVRNLAATGSVSAGLKVVTKAATDTLTAAECRGCVISNYGQAAENTQTLPAAAEGLHGLVVIGTAGAGAFHLKAGAGDKIYL